MNFHFKIRLDAVRCYAFQLKRVVIPDAVSPLADERLNNLLVDTCELWAVSIAIVKVQFHISDVIVSWTTCSCAVKEDLVGFDSAVSVIDNLSFFMQVRCEDWDHDSSSLVCNVYGLTSATQVDDVKAGQIELLLLQEDYGLAERVHHEDDHDYERDQTATKSAELLFAGVVELDRLTELVKLKY